MGGKWTRTIVALLISGIAATWFLVGVEWSSLGGVLGRIKVGWVALAAGILLLEFLIRALRWKVLLRPLLGAPARVSDLWAAQVIGAAANTIFPLRAGEVAKPLVAARRTGHPIAAVVATAVMERVYDLFGLLTVLMLMVLVLPPVAEGEGELVTNLKLYGCLFGAFAITCMGIFFFLATRKESARSVFELILKVAPAPVRRPFMGLFDGFVSGLGNARDLKGLSQAGALSVWMWVNGAVAIFCLFQAFEMPLPFGAACFVAVAIALTVALPQAPGFLGVFHVAIEKTMVLWGQELAPAQGFAIVFWGVSFLPVTLAGLLAMWQEGLSWSSLKAAREEMPEGPEGEEPEGTS